MIAGDRSLPLPPEASVQGKPTFRTIWLKDKELRVVCLTVQTSEPCFSRMIVQAAETRNTRAELAGQITLTIVMAQLVLIMSGAVAIWIGVGRSLRALAEVGQTVERRTPGNLSPLEVDEPEELVSLVNALNRLFKQLQDDIEWRKRFTSNAAHQLRTPLTVLGTYCDLACKLVKDVEAQDVLKELEAGINCMTKLVNRLLSLARSEPAVAGPRNFTVVDLNNCASAASAAHVPEAIKKTIEIEFHASPQPAPVYGDRSALDELVSNLVENSISYTQPGGNVVVEISVAAGKTILEVKDDGPGIPVDERERIFERFYRIAGTDQPGTGLGLAIVKEIATAHNATIAVSTGLGEKGVSITVRFPEPTQSEAAPTSHDKKQPKIRRTS